jgi:hypothetical protein
MNRFNTHNPLFEDDKSFLVSFFKSETSALIRLATKGASVQAPTTIL